MRTKFVSVLHDAEVTGLCFDAKRAELTIHCFLADGSPHSLIFLGVKAWRLSEFRDQNVISVLDELNGEAWRDSEEGRDPYYQDVASSIEANDVVYRMESSIGVEGAIVATGFHLERLEPPS